MSTEEKVEVALTKLRQECADWDREKILRSLACTAVFLEHFADQYAATDKIADDILALTEGKP